MAGLPDDVEMWLEHRLEGVSFQATRTQEETLAALSNADWSLLVIDNNLAGPAVEDALRRLQSASQTAAPRVVYALDKTAGGDVSARLVGQLGVEKVLFHPLDGEEVARQAAAVLGIPLPPATEEGGAQSMPPAATELWERVKETNLSRLDVLEQTALALLEGTLDAELRATAQREAAKLASSLDTFGFTQGAHLVREMEQILQGTPSGSESVPADRPATGTAHLLGFTRRQPPISESNTVRFSELILSLRQELESSPAGERLSEPESSTNQPLLLVVSSDNDLAERLLMQALARGMRAKAAASSQAARAFVSRVRPDAVLLDLSYQRGAQQGLHSARSAPQASGQDSSTESLVLLSELGGITPPVPALVLAHRDTFVDRVQVASLGGRAFLQKWLPPSEILDAVAQVLQQTRAGTSKVLVVDDDPKVLASIRAMLEPHGITLTALNDPLRFWDVLEMTAPDLVVLDMDMRYVSGAELCRVVRNDARWSSTPVLFLTENRDLETVHRVFAAGADDFVSKTPTIIEPELVSRIVSRVQRAQLFRTMTETDSLTGLVNRRKAVQMLGQFLQCADGTDHVCLGVLQVDNFREINDKYGQVAGDAVLRRLAELLMSAFRGADLVARWGGAAFLIGLYGMSRSAGAQRLAEVLETARQEAFFGAADTIFRVTFSAGVAQYPEDGADLQALQRAADEALLQAKSAGGDRVVPAGWRPDTSQDATAQTVDVVVVDDDDALAGLLPHALETRGYRTHRLTDGEVAALALGGPNPSLRARVVLLDVDLPGLDGFGVLRRLAGDGVVQRTRVIMLTHRAVEMEVLKALEMGAFDHVSKPFSLPVLMHRIGRAMEA